MRVNSHHTSPIVCVLLLCTLALSGCAGAVVGVGTAAVTSSTEKGFFLPNCLMGYICKIKDRFIQVNASLLTTADVTVNDGAVCYWQVKTRR